MAEQQGTYEDFMNAGDSAAFDDHDWERAIQAYSMAIRARPDLPEPYNSLGLALLQVQPPRLDEALKIYQKSHSLDKNDLIPLEKSADVFERMGRLQDAVKQYIAVADSYLEQHHDLEKAISNWERATRLTPGLVKIHQKLALAYTRIGEKQLAIYEYLTLADIFHRVKRAEIAEKAVQKALTLDGRNAEALNALQAIRSGSEVIYRDKRLSVADVDDLPSGFDPEFTDLFMFEEEVEEANPKGPLGDSTDIALENLAMYIGEADMMMDPGIPYLLQAIEYHRVGMVGEAADAYEQAEAAGTRNSAISMSLGELMVDLEEWQNVIKHLDRLKNDPSYQAGANHGLGLAYMHLGDVRRACQLLLRAMQLADSDKGLDIGDVGGGGHRGAVYDRFMQETDRADEIILDTANQRFADTLSGKNWKRRLELSRHQFEDALTENPDNIFEVVAVSPEIINSMNLIDEYVRARRFNLAMDEAFYVIEKESDYLAVHLRVGQILVQLNQIRLAIQKYTYVAQTYLERGNRARALEIFNEVIKVAPMDIQLRYNLIEMLEEDERWPDVLDQYINLAKAYLELADVGNARTTFNQAVQLAQRIGADKTRIVSILHQLGDIEMQRLELRPALRAYENVKNLEPTDEKARRMLIDLSYRLSDPVSAVRELDSLLQLYAKQRNGKAIMGLLESWVKERPNDEAIRSRLAAVYQQIRRPDAALEQLDALLELQINNSRHSEACETIKKILGLNPPSPTHYRNLVQQLGCR
jgi:tetratricopeptide (TPR) repeat protein